MVDFARIHSVLPKIKSTWYKQRNNQRISVSTQTQIDFFVGIGKGEYLYPARFFGVFLINF